MADAPKKTDTSSSPGPSTKTKGKSKSGQADPGKPHPPGSIDPELLKLAKPRTKVGWLLALSVLVFCLYWMISLRHDLVYSRAGDEPTVVEPAKLGEISSESYVQSVLVPDRAQLARIWTGRDIGVHASVVLGHPNVWLITQGSAFFAGEPSYDNIYSGRLKRLGELPFFTKLATYYAGAPLALEPVAPAAIAAAIREGKSALPTAHGDPVHVDPESLLQLSWRSNDRVWVTVSPNVTKTDESKTSVLIDPNSWKAALTSAGLEVLGQADPPTSGNAVELWTFEVRAPAGIEAVKATISGAGLSVHRVAPIESRLEVAFAKLKLDSTGRAFKTSESASIPIADVSLALVPRRLTPTKDAVVLIAGEAPSDFWYLLPLYVLLLVISGLFGFTFLRAVRGSAPPTPPPAGASAPTASPKSSPPSPASAG